LFNQFFTKKYKQKVEFVLQGMTYLHSTKVVSHGDLSAHTVLIDSRFVTKITDYGMGYFRPSENLSPPDEDDKRDFAGLLWRAPELLRRPTINGSQKGEMKSHTSFERMKRN
jgi:guanylate cyclase, other